MRRDSRNKAPDAVASKVDLMRLRMDLEAFRRQTIRFIDSAIQQIDAILPPPPSKPFDWRKDIKNW